MRKYTGSLEVLGWLLAGSLYVTRMSAGAPRAGQPGRFGAAARAPRPRPRVSIGEHFIHIGYHKTASTWLQVCVFPSLAGVRYGDPLLENLVTNLSTASDRAFFAEGFRSVLRQVEGMSLGPLLLSYEGLSGSLWDGTDVGFRNAARLRSLMPGGRIMVVVRRQDEMLRSVHAQYVNEGGTRSLQAFVEGGVEGSRFSLRLLEYDRLVGYYVDLFGRDRVWVVPYEHLRANRDRFLGDLCEFLDAQLTAEISGAWPNQSLSPPSLRLLRAWNRLFRPTRFNPAPSLLALPWASHVRPLMQGRIDPVVRRLFDTDAIKESRWLADIAAEFAGSNERLQSFCAESLAAWGYPLPRATVSAPEAHTAPSSR